MIRFKNRQRIKLARKMGKRYSLSSNTMFDLNHAKRTQIYFRLVWGFIAALFVLAFLIGKK